VHFLHPVGARHEGSLTGSFAFISLRVPHITIPAGCKQSPRPFPTGSK
jgi:hypothetical protein